MNWKEIHPMISRLLEFQLLEFGETQITLGTALLALAILALTYWISTLVQKAFVRGLKLRGVEEPGSLGVSRRLIHYVVMLVGLGVALENLGISLSTFFAAGAVFAVTIGFAMQNIAQNFVAGVILLVERVIKPGDVLEVDGRVVRVIDLGIRATIVRTRDEEVLIVPNSLLAQATVKNYTFRDSLYRLRADVGVSYDSDLAQVRKVLEKTARGMTWRSRTFEPVVVLTGFGSSSVDYQISVWAEDPWKMQQLLSKLYEGIWWALKEAHIVIAYPQLDLHLQAPVPPKLLSALRPGDPGKPSDPAETP
jgi:small-conductance mechanosensitive channel